MCLPVARINKSKRLKGAIHVVTRSDIHHIGVNTKPCYANDLLSPDFDILVFLVSIFIFLKIIIITWALHQRVY
jgi:hypothetical protein